jgi:flavin-binding protein dodecin
VKEQRGGLQQGRLEYQVTLEVYFKLEAESGDKAAD